MVQHFRRFDFAPDLPHPLGRHELHDDRSRHFNAVALLDRQQLSDAGTARPRGISVNHVSHEPPWDQGDLGSCTANAALGVLMTDPLWRNGWAFQESDAQQLYREETLIDDVTVPGHWPPTDTGSTGLWSMKALMRRGLIQAYVHCFSLNSVIATLEQRPVSVGLPWLNSMFTPDSNTATVPVIESSGIAGGHQIALVGVDAARRLVRFRNSWGTGWGDGGYAWMSFGGLDMLLRDGGDAVTPVVQAGTAARLREHARQMTQQS